MNDETKQYMEWHIGDLKEYREKLKEKGMLESVVIIDYVISGVEQFLENPSFLKAI